MILKNPRKIKETQNANEGKEYCIVSQTITQSTTMVLPHLKVLRLPFFISSTCSGQSQIMPHRRNVSRGQKRNLIGAWPHLHKRLFLHLAFTFLMNSGSCDFAKKTSSKSFSLNSRSGNNCTKTSSNVSYLHFAKIAVKNRNNFLKPRFLDSRRAAK